MDLNKKSYQLPKIYRVNHKKSHSIAVGTPISLDIVPKVPSQRTIYKQIVSQRDIIQPKILKGLKQNIQKQYRQYKAILEQHSLRVLKFAEKRQKQLENIEKQSRIKSNVIYQRQQKAYLNRKQSMIYRSKNMQNSRNKWQQIVNKRKKSQLKQLKNSSKVIQQWQDKINSSMSRKNLRLQQVSSSMRQHLNKVQDKLNKSIEIINPNINNSQKYHQSYTKKIFNSNNPENFNSSGKSSRAYSRVSTEEVLKKYNQLNQESLERSLFQSVEKQKRIQEARAVKEYINHQRKKRLSQRAIFYQNSQKNKINQIKERIEENHKALNSKFKQNRKQMLENSLPAILNQKVHQQTNQNHPKQSQEIIYEPNYHKHIVEKLRNMSILLKIGQRLK